jgi:hypothetical protein
MLFSDRAKVMPAIGVDDPEMSYRHGYQELWAKFGDGVKG